MGMLGDFLEAVYGLADPFHSVRASIRQWCDCSRAERAHGGNRRIMGRKKAPSQAVSRIEQTNLSIWIAHPGRLRIEKERRCDNRVETSLLVMNGHEWWHRDHEGHVEISREDRRSPAADIDAKRHFDRALLREFFVSLDLECIGAVRTAEHDCVRLRAIPRADSRRWPHWLPCGAEEYEFHAEPRRGALLSVIGRYGGEPFEINEITQATFDEPLDKALFTYTPGFGEQVRSADVISERLTLDAAVKRMDFVVLVPTRLAAPDEGPLWIMYLPPRLRSPRPYLTLGYESVRINESGSPDPEWDHLEWERVERGGKSLRISDPGGQGERVVALEQEGTYVTIWSDMDRERLLDLATSLTPVRRDPR